MATPYAAAFMTILGFGVLALGIGLNPVGFRCQTIFFVLLFGIILLTLFEVWWRDRKPMQQATRT